MAVTYNLAQLLGNNYGRHLVQVKSSETGYEDSDYASLYYDVGATIAITGAGVITITDIISGITSFGVYVDDTLVDTVSYDNSASWSLDMTDYEDVIADGKHIVSLNAIGIGVAANRSNPVVWFCGTAPIYGVSGLYASTPALTRTDDAEGLDFVITSSTGAVDSDFNNVFPWNVAEVIDDDAGKFLQMPDMYFRVGVDNNNRITDVAVSAMPGATGDWYLCPSFAYGCYGASLENNKYVSKTGKTRSYNITRANARTYAANNGSGYCQLDLYHHTVMMFLWWIEFATKDSQSIMKGRVSGSGTSGGSSSRPTGGTDSISTPSGFETTYSQMRWHYIEDFVGNFFEWVDGICCGAWNSTYSATADPTKFADTTTNMVTLSYSSPPSSSNYCIAAFGWDPDHPFLCMPCLTVNNNSYSTYFCDQIYLNGSGYPVLFVGDSYGGGDNDCGLARCNASSVGNYSYYLGARLLKLS